MRDKQELLAEIQQSLTAGVLTENDLRAFVHSPEPTPTIVQPQQKPAEKPEKLSAVE